jgi:serine O-acetyltransferase
MNPSDISFWSLVREDFATHNKEIFSQGFFALLVQRFGNWRMGVKFRLLRLPLSIIYFLLSKWTQVFCGIKLDYTVQVGRRVKIEHFGGMVLGARRIGDDVVIRQNVTFGIKDSSDLCAKPTIENNVSIGAGAVIVGDIVIGHDSKIGPNVVVIKDVPPFSTVYIKPQVVLSSQIVKSETDNNE